MNNSKKLSGSIIIYLLTLFCLITYQGYAQVNTTPLRKGDGKITGILSDSTSNAPVPFGTVAVLDPTTRKPVDGTITDDAGRFKLDKLAPGDYILQYSSIGYVSKNSHPIQIKKGSEIQLGNISLASETKLLNEVTVQGVRDVIEEKVDRIVYHADNDLTSAGGDATDVMRKVPMLTVDLDGNVSLKGSQNVKVLINNKPSTISANSVAAALKQIPASMIRSVEVITSPSSKYDAEGSGGIINIITKKNALQGGSLNTDLSAGNRGASLSLNGGYRKGKMGFTLGGFLWTTYNVKGAFDNTQSLTTTAGNLTTIQSADTKTAGQYGTYQLGWDYDIDSTSFLTGSVRYGVVNSMYNQNNMVTSTYFPGQSQPVSSARQVSVEDLSGTVDANLTYTKIYKPSKELSVMGLFSRNNRTNSFTADLLDYNDLITLLGRQRNNNPSYNQEATLQIDYQTVLAKNQNIEFGGKGISRRVNSSYQYLTASANGNYVMDSSVPSNELVYDQSVMAGYISHSITTTGNYMIKTGARYEYTIINAAFANNSEQLNSAIQNYGVLVPSINVSKKLKNGMSIKLGYNRRIQRPGIQFLNPNTNTSNPNNITVGNPTLSPELTSNVELGISGQLKAFFVNATLFGRYTGDVITSVRDTLTRTINGERTQVVSTTFENIGREQAVGVNVFSNATFFSKWQVGASGTVYYTDLSNNSPIAAFNASNSGVVISGQAFTSLKIKNGWGIQAFAGRRGNQVQLQGSQSSIAFYAVGVKKEFDNKRGSIGIATENFFNHPFKIKTEVNATILTQNSIASLYNAGVRLAFSYRIGNTKADGQAARKKKTIKNDDVKGNDDGSNSGAPVRN